MTSTWSPAASTPTTAPGAILGSLLLRPEDGTLVLELSLMILITTTARQVAAARGSQRGGGGGQLRGRLLRSHTEAALEPLREPAPLPGCQGGRSRYNLNVTNVMFSNEWFLRGGPKNDLEEKIYFYPRMSEQFPKNMQ